MIRPDWDHIAHCLMTGEAAIRPWEIRKFTMPEIALFLDSEADKPSPPEGSIVHAPPGPPGTYKTREEFERAAYEAKLEWIAQRRRMTVKQRLEEAKREVRRGFAG